jgi:hypothetical protein
MRNMKDLTRAISIRQPWVELILSGEKQAEYRSRPTNIRGRVFIYASLTPAETLTGWNKVGKQPGELPTGQIVGTVEIVDCVWDAERKCFAYILKKPERLAEPLFAKNQPQPVFWRPVF